MNEVLEETDKIPVVEEDAIKISMSHEELTKYIMYTLIDLQIRLTSIQEKLGISTEIEMPK
jgi:hypothetical protein